MLSRVEREKTAWNDGIERSSFDSLFSHGDAYWDDYVDDILRNAFAAHENGRFLEIGSQTWQSWMARLKTPFGKLDCINISEAELDLGRAVLKETGTTADFHIMDAHKLEFPDDSFDVVFGKAILHHLDYAVALSEINRVLKSGGIMVFMEPLDINPVMRLVRHLTPALRTPDEEPVRERHLAMFRKQFEMDVYPVQLWSAAVSPLSQKLFSTPGNFLTRTAFQVDRAERVTWYTVMV